jgi:hypothetical protein
MSRKQADFGLELGRLLDEFHEECKRIILIDEFNGRWKIIPLDGTKPVVGNRMSDLVLALAKMEGVG